MAKCYASVVIKNAENEVGYLEKKSNSQLDSKTANAGDNNYTKYARDLDALGDFYNGKKNGYPYCDIFVDWLFYKSFGLDDALRLLCQPKKSYGAGCQYSYNYYKNAGRVGKEPKVGAQIFFVNPNGKIYHTGIVYKFDDTYVYTIEGNTSSDAGVVENGGSVEKKKYKLNYTRIKGYGYPDYDEEPIVVKKNYLSKGDEGKDVVLMQTMLIYCGYSCGKSGADGNFGLNTDVALRAFQKDNNLTVDGKYGNASKTALTAKYQQKQNQVAKAEAAAKQKKADVLELQKAINKDLKPNPRLAEDGSLGPKTEAQIKKIILKKPVVGSFKVYPNIIKFVQRKVGASADGAYGNESVKKVKEYQKKNGLKVDGIVGYNTLLTMINKK
jgi:peptidoglycan hydrolase-like protein with peptidoglycan-binding domain